MKIFIIDYVFANNKVGQFNNKYRQNKHSTNYNRYIIFYNSSNRIIVQL